MIKKEEECNEEEEEENDSTVSNKQKRKEIVPQICITASHISMFSSSLKNVQDIHCKYSNVFILHSDNIKQAIMDDRNKKSLNPIEIVEEDVADMENVLDPSEYMQMAWESM